MNSARLSAAPLRNWISRLFGSTTRVGEGMSAFRDAGDATTTVSVESGCDVVEEVCPLKP